MSYPLGKSGRHPAPARHAFAAQPMGSRGSADIPTTTTTTSTAVLTTTSTVVLTTNSTASCFSTLTSTSAMTGAGSLISTQPVKTDVERLKEVAQARDRHALQALLDQGVDIDARDDQNGRSALHALAESGDAEGVLFLIKANANVNLKDYENFTPLTLAAQQGQLETLAALMQGGSNLNVRDFKGRTPLMLAAQHGKHETVAALIDGGALPNIKDSNGRIALQYAARYNSPLSVKYLCLAGSKVHAQARLGKRWTALHFAASHGDLTMVRTLVEAGTSVKKKCAYGTTPFLQAAGSGNVEVLRYLKECGSDIRHVAEAHSNTGFDALDAMCLAAKGGHVQAIRLLHSWGLDVNGHATLDESDRPICWAIEADQVEAAKTLAELGARPEKNAFLEDCVEKGKVDITRLLLDWGDDPNDSIVDSATGRSHPILWMAVYRAGLAMVRLLVERGAKLDPQLFPDSLLAQAARGNQSETVRWLVNELGMDANFLNKSTGKTALMWAAECGALETVKQLLELGANPRICPGHDHNTAAALAARRGHADVLRVLASHGARPHEEVIRQAMERAIQSGWVGMVQALIELGYKPRQQDRHAAVAQRERKPAIIDRLAEHTWPHGDSFADVRHVEQLFKWLLAAQAGSLRSDDKTEDAPMVKAGSWPHLTEVAGALWEAMPALLATQGTASPVQELVWFSALLPSMGEPNYEEAYGSDRALSQAARKQYAEFLTAASSILDKQLLGGMQAQHIRCIHSLVFEPEPIESLALVLHQETGLLMPLATAMAECWKRAIEKAGELPMKGKLKDLGKTLEQQILPYLVQELASLPGRAGVSAPEPGDAPPAYFRILDRQLEALAEYRKSLEQHISQPIAGSPERIADYA